MHIVGIWQQHGAHHQQQFIVTNTITHDYGISQPADQLAMLHPHLFA